MSRIDIFRAHQLDAEQQHLALDDLHAYLTDFGARTRREHDSIHFSGPGYEGEVSVNDREVVGSIRLGLLARPFRRQLEAEILRHLDARLG